MIGIQLIKLFLFQSEVRATNEITFMLTNHVRELNEIFGDTVFTIHKDTKEKIDVKGIEFEIKKIVVSGFETVLLSCLSSVYIY